MDVRKECHEKGFKLPVDQARSRVIRGNLIEMLQSLDATTGELFDELVWLEQNEDELPEICPQCSRVYKRGRAMRRGCSVMCRRLLRQEVPAELVKSGN